MLKQAALIVMLLALLNSPLAWSQDRLDRNHTDMQADEDESSGDEVDMQEEEEWSGDEVDMQEEEESSGDEVDMQEEEESSGDEVDMQEEDESSGDEVDMQEEEEEATVEDEATDQIDDESLADDASEIEDDVDLESTDPMPPQPAPVVKPAPASPPVVSNPQTPASPSDASCFRCDSGRPVGMSNPTRKGLFSMSIPTSKGQCSDRQSGVVKWFNRCKGYGFITPDSGQDLFFHIRSKRGDSWRDCFDKGQR